MYQKNNIFAPFNLTNGRVTSELIAGFFYARKHAAYNPVPTLNGLESPLVGLNNGKCTPFFFSVHMFKNTNIMQKSNNATGGAQPEFKLAPNETYGANRLWGKTGAQREAAIIEVAAAVKQNSCFYPEEKEILIKREMLKRRFLFTVPFIGKACISSALSNDWIIEKEQGEACNLIKSIDYDCELPLFIGKTRCYMPIFIWQINPVDKAAYNRIVKLVGKGGSDE